MISCVEHYKQYDTKLRDIIPETLYFDKAGSFQWHPLAREFLLKKKVCIEKMKKENEDGKGCHPPEVNIE